MLFNQCNVLYSVLGVLQTKLNTILLQLKECLVCILYASNCSFILQCKARLSNVTYTQSFSPFVMLFYVICNLGLIHDRQLFNS